MKKRITVPNFNQQGITLMITLIVMLTLTMLGLASMSDNRMQSVVVRNNQFQFEVFNSSYSEIDAQVDMVNNRNYSDGVPPALLAIIDADVGTAISSESPNNNTKLALLTDQDEMDKTVSEVFSGDCVVFGQAIGVGVSQVVCSEVQITTTSQLVNTSISSGQFQLFEYTSLSSE